MQQSMDLLKETIAHFEEGARSVRAHTNDITYVISKNGTDFWVATEEPGFPKTKAESLEEYFKDVFGIEAKY